MAGGNKLTIAHGCYWEMYFFAMSRWIISRSMSPGSESALWSHGRNNKTNGSKWFHFVDEAAPASPHARPGHRNSPAKINRIMVDEYPIWKNRSSRSLHYWKRPVALLYPEGQSSFRSTPGSDSKGVTVAQVAQVCRNFTKTGIMVHAYLMYGYPTQTAQETIDSLEMVRQMFKEKNPSIRAIGISLPWRYTVR